MKGHPKIGICAAFEKGLEVTSFVLDYPYQIEFIATYEEDNSEYEHQIAELCEKKNIPVLRKINVNSENFIKLLKEKDIDIIVLAWWPTIIKKNAIESVNIGWINLHPTLLPYNRGKHGYYWSVVEGTPFGVTIHFIDEGIDSGKILFQKPMEIKITDTGQDLYINSANEVVNLFKEVYPRITNLDFSPQPQQEEIATNHFSKDIEQHSQIILDKNYKAIDLINIIRGRTFPNGNSAYFFLDGKKYLVKIKIEEANK